MKLLKAFGLFCYDFVIGDDWKIAAYVVVTLALVALASTNDVLSDGVAVVLGILLAMVFFVAGVRYDSRKSR
jgi:hypothetical protein